MTSSLTRGQYLLEPSPPHPAEVERSEMIVDENLRSKRTSNYPEALSIHKVKGQNVQLRFYGQDSDYNRLAMISHYLHNTDLLSEEDRKIAVGYIKDFIRSIKPDASDEHTSMICENPFQ